MTYHLSILDKSLVADGSTAEQALRDSVVRAQRAEQLGYHRYWFAEHHALPQSAGPAPEVLAAFVLAQTQRIRIGTGGVMLRHYSPYKVAEVFNLLANLAPGRVDLGVGKAPGGLPAASHALAYGRETPLDFVKQLTDLEGFLSGNLPPWHRHADAIATPTAGVQAERFLLGASVESAELAASLGWRFVYAGQFDGDARSIERAFSAYRRASNLAPLLAVIALAADSAAEAARHIGELRIHRLHFGDRQTINLPSSQAAADYARQAGINDYNVEELQPSVLAGTAQHVRRELDRLHTYFGIEEFVLDAPVADAQVRLRSLELLAPSTLPQTPSPATNAAATTANQPEPALL